MIEHGFLGVKYARSYQWLHDKYQDQVQAQYQAQTTGGAPAVQQQPQQREEVVEY